MEIDLEFGKVPLACMYVISGATMWSSLFCWIYHSIDPFTKKKKKEEKKEKRKEKRKKKYMVMVLRCFLEIYAIYWQAFLQWT